ncbi:MAG: hypothetical protein WD469_07625 [Paenibacillaceae bacterium]
MLNSKRKIAFLFTMLAAIMFLSGCNGKPISRIISQPNTIIDWVDFLKLNNISYTGSWQAALTDVSKLGEEIGKVAFQVADHVHDPHYITKDGDAAFLVEGTVVRAIDGYPNHEIVAVQDTQAIGGYKLYIADGKQKTLGLTFEEAVHSEISKISFYPMDNGVEPVAELENGSQMFLVSLLQQTAQGQTVDMQRGGADPIYYRFVMDNGAAIGYIDTIYKNGNHYYWNHPEAKMLPSAFAYYLANERDSVYKIQEMDFPLPNHADILATGERIKRDGSINNITLIATDGVTERSLFAQETIDQLWGKAREINPSDGENKVYLYMADRAMPVSNGQLIAYATNKDTVVKQGGGSFNVNVINQDGTGDRVIVDGSKYGGSVRLLDSVDDRIVAAGEDRSLLDISIATGQVHHYPINGMLDALSVDGKYVLYRKMVGDSQVGTGIAAFDLDSGKSIELGNMDKNYVFAQGVK